jgi:alpha-galactosidase
MVLRRLTVLCACIALWLPGTFAAGPRTLVATGTVRVQADAGDRLWSIGNDRITLSIGLDQDSNFSVRGIGLPGTDRRIDLGGGSDHVLSLNRQAGRFGLTSDGWDFVEAVPLEADGGARLGFIYVHTGHGVRVTRWYATSQDTPTVETWDTVEAMGEPVTLDGLNLWQVVLEPGDVDWLTGLQVPEGAGGPFTRQRTHLEPGDQLKLGAHGRSSEFTVPWFAVAQGQDTLYVGLMWSGAWGASVARQEGELRVTVGLPATVTTVTPGVALDTPHLFFGVAQGPSEDVAESLSPFLRQTLRRGRDWDPLVTYNTWFAYGTHVDEEIVLDELRANAALGTELFVLDAGWYPGSQDYWDFASGLGLWEVDAERFPSGLAALGDDARNQGMKFGIWVEPERADLAVVFARGIIQERWLATRDGLYDPNLSPEDTSSAQICLADVEARLWLFNTLVQFIEEHRPDYLKWDNNLWVNCNRAGHGHGPDDGNFKHVQGLYALLRALRERFPELAIENCSGGGNRLDFGMAQFTDVAWMDDQSAPSARVRHNIEGLSQIFPPAYLLSFLMAGPEEPVVDAPDLLLYARSRMPGILGLCFRAGDLDDETATQLAQEVATYKRLRDVLRTGSMALLTPQATVEGNGWDAVQTSSVVADRAVLFAYQRDRGVAQTLIRPVELDPDQVYLVSTVDDGNIGTALGADLMSQGLGVHGVSRSAAHIIILSPAPTGVPGVVRRH